MAEKLELTPPEPSKPQKKKGRKRKGLQRFLYYEYTAEYKDRDGYRIREVPPHGKVMDTEEYEELPERYIVVIDDKQKYPNLNYQHFQ